MGRAEQGRAVVERDEQVEIDLVPLVGEDGELRFQLEQRHWAEGIGWYTQKTITLDAPQARRLQQLLAVQSPQISRGLTPRSRPAPPEDRGRVLPFRRAAR